MAKIAVVEDNDAMRAQLCGSSRSMRRRVDTSWT